MRHLSSSFSMLKQCKTTCTCGVWLTEMDLVTLQPNFGLQNWLSQIWSLWALQHWGCGLTTLSRIFRSAHVGRCTIKLLPQQQHFSIPALCDQSYRGVQQGEWKWGVCLKPLLSLLHQTAPGTSLWSPEEERHPSVKRRQVNGTCFIHDPTS